MALSPGTRLGPYEILAPLGAGGMGEVYRARDTRLERTVAIKILPEALAGDPQFRERFDREARAISQLDHPHICALHDVGDEGGTAFLVMQYLEGETLADRLANGALPLDQALRIGIEIAGALAAAHRAGIVHRDLKPGNIMLTKAGAKLLDFGLAKSTAPAIASTGASMLPTTPPNLTQQGTILGTFQYMAPEQLEGQEADARTDIFAFGALLYEMITGRKAFEGKSQASLIGAILKDTPPAASTLQPIAPKALDRIIATCLAKDPDARWQSAGDLARELTWVSHGDSSITTGAPTAEVAGAMSAGRGRRIVVPVVAAAAIAVAAAAAVAYLRPVPAEAPEMRLQVVTPPPGGDNGPVSFAISPDGQSIVFRAAAGPTQQLWLRTLGSEVARPLAGTEGALFPFWSPDGRSIGFFADQKLKRIDVAGGSVQTLADAPGNYGATWGAEGIILFSGANTSPLYRVPASGGQPPVEATRIEAPGQAAHRFPHFLPDGRRFLFFATGAPDVQGVFVGTLDSMDATRLVDADTAAVFVPPDWVLFGRGESLHGQRVDRQAMTPIGDPVLVADGVAQNPASFASVALSASATGLFAYRTPVEAARELVWTGRQGAQTGTLGITSGLGGGGTRLSRDGRTVAVSRVVDGNQDIWLIETARGVLRRFTFDAANDGAAVWSPDGGRVAFHASRKGGGLNDLYEKSLSGSAEQVLLESPENKNMMDWSPDGRFILYSSQNPKTARDIWALPLDGDRKPFVVVQTGFDEAGARFSSDGRWIAYQSNETGRVEVFVQPFPGPGRSWQISTNGGAGAEFRADGRELFYRAPDNRLMAVPLTLDAKGVTVDAGNPVALFPLRPGAVYTSTSDGQRFLINQPTDDATASPITVVLNWKPPAP